MKRQNVTNRTKISWRVGQLPDVTGLSEAFWRKAVRLEWLPVRRVGGAVIILDEDLKAFLKGQEETSASAEVQHSTGDHASAQPAKIDALP